ncbi:uncharacterized protein BDZ99DRAFT_567033 [Mytilinidion resinicola]|uniref:Protein kinase domain-containing protein n=1 Tax=Mytilinidion resinicola TaxID=574789 RepID=A0A6A6Z2U5_9PEZI|nr:uncharacterized protein BDZ99DRAFT_567033 [Mytilinidion resinicola]KAF2815138.1 hypothetical protein BDZ99DRAFT_567033 [Mytilinidion resinicola]
MSLRKESLEQQLRDALCQHAHKESKGFLPLDKLNQLVVEDSVVESLKKCMPELSVARVGRLAKNICPGSVRHSSRPSFCRIFAILVMIERPQEIPIFVNNNITDHELPLVKARNENTGRSELRRKTQPNKSLECLNKWSSLLVDLFEGYQWTLLSRFFSRGNNGAVRFYPLDDQTILPFIEDSSRDATLEDDEDFQGGHGSVSRVKIHPSHFDFHDIAETYETDSTFAVKCLHSRSREMFSREVDALKRLSGQKHIVPLLATFEYKNSYHLLFPWANANLRRYWAMFPNPSTDTRYGLWVAKQCKGIAEGLSVIHEPPTDQSDDYAYEPALQPSHGQPQRTKAYGRHGDIKPENILWFRNGPNTDIGVLEIADFGLTRFHHRQSRSNISPVGMGNSPTYRAPEFDMPDGLLSRSYDIWALGCLYLEFISWYFLGWSGVMEFSASRETKRNDLSADDCYFELSGSRGTDNICSKVKPAVIRWMAYLRQHWACSWFFHDFLDLIQNEMLVVETNGESPVRRVTAAGVTQSIVTFYNRSGSDAKYLSGNNPLNVPPTTRLSHPSWVGNSQYLETRRQPSSVAELEGYDASVPHIVLTDYDLWELELDLPETETRANHLSSSSTSGSKEGSTSLSDVRASESSTSISNLSRRQVSTTQTTQDTNLGQSEHERYFACPFFKRNPSKYGKMCSNGWKHIHRVKEHLYRRHLLTKHRCTRCLAYFEDGAGLEAHTRSVTPCALSESPDIEGINAEQERRLRSRKRTRTDATSGDIDRDCERWWEMYKIIFPDTNPEHISPHNDYSHLAFTTPRSSETIADYSKFLNQGIPSDVQIELQATISRELGLSEVDGRKIIDMISVLQRTLLQSFQSQRGNSRSVDNYSTSS